MARATTASTAPTAPATTTKKASVKTPAAKTPAAKPAAKKAAPKAAPAAKKAAPKTSAAEKSTAKATTKATAKKAAAPAKKAAAKTDATPAKKAPAAKAPAKKAAAPAKPAAKKAAAPAKAPAKKPAKAKSPFDAKFLDAQRALLLEERGRLLHDADILTAEAYDLAQGRDPGDVQFDEESGEGDTLQVERERDLALSAQFRLQVEEIDRALLKFDAGTYGVCEVSGTPIPKERLRAIPWARERVEYKVGGFGRR
jgi:RNA polymerase-binding transcription factor DksA